MSGSKVPPLLVPPAIKGSGSGLNLKDDQKRWLVTGICLNKILLPALRDFVGPEMIKHYAHLRTTQNIDKQSHAKHLHKDGKYNLNYGSINNNDVTHRKKTDLYDYNVKSAVDLAKLYLQPFMAKFTGFDDTCDLSAVLGILSSASVFSSAVQGLSSDVRKHVRNEWGHCNFGQWNGTKFAKSFQQMESLVRALTLSKAEEKRITDELQDWKTKGLQLCLGNIVDADLVTLIKTEVAQLNEDVKHFAKNQADEALRVSNALQSVQEALEEHKEINKDLESLKKSQVNLSQRVDDVAEETSAIGKTVDTLKDDQKNLTAKFDNIEKNQDTLTKRVEEGEDKQVCLEQKVVALETSICKVKAAASQDLGTQLKDHLIKELATSDFGPEIDKKCKFFHPKTRQWVLDQVQSHVNIDQRRSCKMLITAGPGIGKSTIAAKICQIYQYSGYLAGCHFFQFSNSTRNNPRLMLQSIATQMSETVPGYREALGSKLQTDLGMRISEMNCEELFTVLLEEPLRKLKIPDQTYVVVLDAIDECCSKLKRELQDILKNKLSLLPTWLRFVITTRPPPSSNALKVEKNIIIDQNDPKNISDIRIFFQSNLQNIADQSGVIEELVKVSDGLFLVASFLVVEIQKERITSTSGLKAIFPRGLSSVYEKYIDRLKTNLLPYIREEEWFFKMLMAFVASENPIPISMMYSILGLKDVSEIPHGERKTRSDALSQLHCFFPVENDHVSAFHKTLIEFLIREMKEEDFNIPAKGRKTSVEMLPEKAESVHGKSKVGDISHATRKDERDKIQIDDGKKVLVEECYDVLSDLLQGKKDLGKPLDLTDSEKYALKFVWNLLESGPNDERFWNYYLISALLCYRQYEDHTILSQTFTYEADDTFHRIFLKCACFFHMRMSHQERCAFVRPFKFGRYVEFVVQTAIMMKVNQEITPSAHELLQNHNLSYCEIEEIDTKQERQDQTSILGCGDGFVLVQQKLTETVFTKYRQDGALDGARQSFTGKRNARVSPNHRFIVVTREQEKGDIEIIDATTLEPVKSFPSPDIIKSCYLFGDQSWYIVARCYNNKIYVIEGETGAVVKTIDAMSEEVEDVSLLGHILLGSIDIVMRRRYSDDTLTDEEGNVVEEMRWFRSSIEICQRKLFLCHYKKPEEKVPIYPLKSRDWCCTSTIPRGFSSDYGESVGFSQDGSLLAFHYDGCIFIRKTEDRSLYKRVYLGPNHFIIFDHRGILLLTEDYVIVYNGSEFNESVIMIINLHTNEIENIYRCTRGLQLLPRAMSKPQTLVTNCYSENRCLVQRYALRNSILESSS